MLFRPGHFCRATALLAAVSHLVLIGCSSSPARQATPVEMTPPAEWDESPIASDGRGNLGILMRKAARGKEYGTGPRPLPPLVPDIRGFYAGQTRCGANPISIEALILGASPDSIRGVASLSDPTTPTDTFFVVYEFRGDFDGRGVGLRPARLLASSGLPLPGDLVGAPTDGDRIQGRFEGEAGNCQPFTLQLTRKVAWDEARYLEQNFGEVVASFLPSAPAPPPVASAPPERTLPPEVQEQIQRDLRSDPSSSGNEFFAPPSEAPATSWVPSWMTTDNVKKYGGYVAAGVGLMIDGVLALRYGGSSAPDPVP